jgi:hypothetical protein
MKAIEIEIKNRMKKLLIIGFVSFTVQSCLLGQNSDSLGIFDNDYELNCMYYGKLQPHIMNIKFCIEKNQRFLIVNINKSLSDSIVLIDQNMTHMIYEYFNLIKKCSFINSISIPAGTYCVQVLLFENEVLYTCTHSGWHTLLRYIFQNKSEMLISTPARVGLQPTR